MHNDQGLMAVNDCLLTIGYGNKRTIVEMIDLLKRWNVRYLVDVRSKPFSRFRPEFSRSDLEASLRSSQFVYLFMGDALGGIPDDPTCYTDGKVDYSKIQERDWFTNGLARLMRGWKDGHRIAIMCAELEPQRCHRSKLIGEALIAAGIPVAHIDEHSDVIAHESVMRKVHGEQPLLFDMGHVSRRSYGGI